MLSMRTPEHVLLAEEFVGILFGLRIEARVVIRIPCVGGGSGSGRRAHDRLVDAADTARTGVETPDVIATARISVTPADESGSANFLRSKNRIEAKDPVAAGGLEIGIGRERLDLGASNQIITSIVADLKILDLLGLRSALGEGGIAIIEAQIVIV